MFVAGMRATGPDLNLEGIQAFPRCQVNSCWELSGADRAVPLGLILGARCCSKHVAITSFNLCNTLTRSFILKMRNQRPREAQ